MAYDPFNNPAIHSRIAADILRISSAWLEWNAEPTAGDYDTKIVETLVACLDAHARHHLDAIGDSSSLPDYRKLLRSIGSALIENAEKRSVLEDPYSEGRHRKMAESSGDIIERKYELTAEELEASIRMRLEKLRYELMPKAMKWGQWKDQMLSRISMSFEARYQYWAAEATERVQGKSQPPLSSAGDASLTGKIPGVESTLTMELSATGPHGDGVDSRTAVDSFISKLSNTGRKVTRKDIWTAAGYTDATEFERFQRNDVRTTKSAAAAFKRVLDMEPKSFIALMDKKLPTK